MKDNIETRVIGLFLVIVGILIYVAYASVENISRSIRTSDWVNHTHDVILQVDAVMSSLHAGDSALRTYLLTGDRRDQGAYRSAYAEMVEHLNEAKALTRSGEEVFLNTQLAEMENLIKARIDFTRGVVAAREQNGLDGARNEMLAHPDVEQMGKLERMAANLIREEKGFLRTRDQEAREQALSTKSVVHLGLIVNFMLLVFSRINPAVLRTTSWEATEIIAHPLDRVIQFTAGEGDAATTMTQSLREGREMQNRAAQLVCKGGRTIPIRFSLIPLHDQDKVVGGVVTVRPVVAGSPAPA